MALGRASYSKLRTNETKKKHFGLWKMPSNNPNVSRLLVDPKISRFQAAAHGMSNFAG